VSPAKIDELMALPFELWAQVGSRNHLLDRDPDPPWEGAVLRGGKGSPL